MKFYFFAIKVGTKKFRIRSSLPIGYVQLIYAEAKQRYKLSFDSLGENNYTFICKNTQFITENEWDELRAIGLLEKYGKDTDFNTDVANTKQNGINVLLLEAEDFIEILLDFICMMYKEKFHTDLYLVIDQHQDLPVFGSYKPEPTGSFGEHIDS